MILQPLRPTKSLDICIAGVKIKVASACKRFCTNFYYGSLIFVPVVAGT